MRAFLAVAGFAAILSCAAKAQFWSDRPDQAAAQPQAGSDAGEPPRAAPASGRAGSLGGSGATGPDSVGTQPQRDTDFDRRTWRDTSFPLVLRLMAALPDRIESAAEHELAKNLLVSIGDAPPGDDGGDRLLSLRVRKLLAMGDIDDAAALARAAPGLTSDPALAHAEVEAELLAGQIEAACIDLRAFEAILTDPLSANGLLLCRQRAGETIEGGVPALEVTSLGAFARIAGAPLGGDPASASPAQLVAMAREPNLAPEQRLQAAYGAGRLSAMTGESLAAVFGMIPNYEAIDDQAPGDPPAAVANGAEGGPPGSAAAAAALYRAIAQEGDTGQKVSLAERGLLSPTGIADKIGVAMAAGLRNLQPEPELGGLAARLAIIFYTLGDTEAAAPWADLAVESGGGAALWPYRMLLKSADPLGIADWEQQSGLDRAHKARIMTILSAFGVAAPPASNVAVAGDRRPEPNFADLIAIDQAAANGHVGETTLRALALLGPGGPSAAHPLALKRALADLDAALLHDEARALAFEAITATLRGY
jgi:tetratricopeptide (TPR) repeat protein